MNSKTWGIAASSDGKCHSLPPVTTPGNVAIGISGTDAVMTWNVATSSLGSIVGYDVYLNSVKRNGSLVTALTYTFSSLAPGVPQQCQVVAIDNAGNRSPLSSPVGFAIPDTSAGQLLLSASAYSGFEGAPLTFIVSRSGGSAGAIAVDWAISGLVEGAPTPPSGTITWAAGESGGKSVTVTAGLVSASRNGSLTLSNARATSGGSTPTIIAATATMTVTQDGAAPSAVTLSATAISSTQINLHATGGVDNESGFAAYVFEVSNNGTSGWTQLASQSSADFWHVVGLPNTQRFYRCRALDKAGNATGYATANATTAGGAPTGFTFDPGWSGLGNFVDGQAVRISYASGGLSIPTDPRPFLWMPLETDAVIDPTYSRATSSPTLQINAAIQSSIKPVNAIGSLKQTYPVPAAAANWFSNEPFFTVNGNSLYLSRDCYWNYPESAENGKMLRLWANYGQAGATDIYIKQGFGQAAAIEGTALTGYDIHGGNTPYYDPFPQDQNVWWTDEFIYKEGTTGNQDGVLDLCRNGGWAFGSGNRNWITKPADANLNKIQAFLDQRSNPTMPNGSGMFLCHLYVNTGSRFRVIVSTESVYFNARSATDRAVRRVPQLPIANSGSPNGCDLFFRKGVYLTLSGLYLWLIDDTETAYRVGRFT